MVFNSYRKRYKRMNVSFNVKKTAKKLCITSLLSTRLRKAQMPLNLTLNSRTKRSMKNGLEVEVKVNGKKQSLK